jgi:hypothetical protein
MLLQESETRARIFDELEPTRHRANPEVTALVYCSGHGGRSLEGGRLLVR